MFLRLPSFGSDTMSILLLLLGLLSVQTSVQPAWVTVSPDRSQYFEYESFSVICDQSSAGWTVWRYSSRCELSQCSSDSICHMRNIKPSDSGVYWCESKHRDCSNVINITVTGGPVVLQSPVLPVTEGVDVTLSCRTRTSSSLPAGFYRDGSLIRNGSAGHMTIVHVSRSDEGVYWCSSAEGQSPSSWLLMKVDSVQASLTVSPDSSQFFEYGNLSLSCGDNSSLQGWRIFRFQSGGHPSSCGHGWGTVMSIGCFLQPSKPQDSATYWCESPTRQRSNSVNITVHGGPVVLQSPVLPVTEGDNVTLSCRTRMSSSLPAGFYRDGSLIRTEPAGHMTIVHVSRSDEGVYWCSSAEGQSPSSWLFVKAQLGSPPSAADSMLVADSILVALRHLLVLSPYCAATLVMVCVYRRQPTGRSPSVSMTTPPPTEDDERCQPCDDVTTEYHF